jgi:signal transduction histidine kinase/tetratricopeptide (TPR) repeat protein
LKKKFLKKIIYIIFIFFFICCNKNKSDESKSTGNDSITDNLDPAFIELKSKQYDTVVRKELKELAVKFVHNKKNYFEIYKYIDEKSTIVNDPFGKIEANTNLGIYYFNKFQNDSAFYHFSTAEKISRSQKGNPFMGAILHSKADLLWCQKNFTEAESMAIKALKIAKQRKNNDLIFSCYITIANSLVGLNKNEEALKYYDKALEAVERVDSTVNKLVWKAATYNYIAHIYQKENNFKEAIKYSNQGLSFDNFKQTDPSMYCYLINTIAYSKFKLGEKSVVNQFNETLKIGDSIQSIPIQITAKTYLGEFYLAQKDTLKAKTYLKDAQLLSHKNNIFEDELKILQLLALANPQNESFYSNRYIELNDSLQNIERATRDKYARIEFETDEISQQKNVVESENDKLTQRIWVISGFAFLILLVVVLWFLNKSQKNKTRELLFKQEQQKANEEIYQLMLNQQQKIEEGKQIEKRRISQELHDGVMGRLSSIRLNLFVLNKKTDQETINKCLEYIKDIQAIEKEIRTIAHDLNKNLFSDSSNFNSIVENLFTAIQNHTQINFILNTDERIDWETVNNNAKINSYRIIQEALQNIDKYAKAQTVTITMSKKDDAISIEIKDDGIGFNMKIAKDGIGLKNMQKRMEDIGGTFEIESYPKKGTKINLSIPI